MVRAYAGIAAPIIVMVVLLFQGATTPGYDPMRQTISELGSGWGGTRIVALYGLVILTCVWDQVAKAVPGMLSVVAWVTGLVVVGVGCIGINETSPEPWPWHRMTWEGRLHLIFAFVFVFGGIPVACLAAARALPPAWRGLRAYSLATGLGTFSLLGSTLMALEASPPNPFVVSHLGLIERAYVFAFMIWQCIVSSRLVRVR